MNIGQIKETCIYVKDLKATRQFYEGKLGLPVISIVPERHIFFRAGRSVLLCFIAEATRQETSLPPHFASGQMHLAFEVAPEEYTGWKSKVQESGIEVIHEQSWRNSLRSFYFRDPDQHLLEIVPEGIWDY